MNTNQFQILKVSSILLAGVAMLASSSCRSTVRGIGQDTERNTHKVGEKVERAGEKIQETAR